MSRWFVAASAMLPLFMLTVRPISTLPAQPSVAAAVVHLPASPEHALVTSLAARAPTGCYL